MKKKMYWIKLFSIILTTGFSVFGTYADEFHSHESGRKHIHGSHDECSLPKNDSDIIECAIGFHPLVRKSGLNIAATKSINEMTNQIPNPKLNARYVKGNESGDNNSELEANLSFVIELGKKRTARNNHAKAKLEEVEKELLISKAKIKYQTIVNMHRLRQLFIEVKLLNESQSAFNRVISQLRKLPRLSAEQEASLSLFELALEELKYEESNLYEEEKQLEHYFHIATGHSLEEIRKFLPTSPHQWPRIAQKPVNGESNSLAINKLISFESIAQKRLEIEKSKGWSNINIGPSLAIEEENGIKNTMIGFNVQIPIPLFHSNQGGKSVARSELAKAKKITELTKKEEAHERAELLMVYDRAIEILKRTLKLSQVEKKYLRIENLYKRGIVSSSIFLDSLSQKKNYLKNRHHRELTAIAAFWKIRNIDGTILEE